MHAWFSPLRARASLFFSAALVAAGLLPVAYFVGVLIWQVVTSADAGKWIALPMSLVFTDHTYAFIPKLPWSVPEALIPVLGRVHALLVFGIVGVALVAVGMIGILRQRAALEAYKLWREDRARRVDDYRRDDTRADAFGRREPIFVQYPKEAYEEPPPAKERWSASR